MSVSVSGTGSGEDRLSNDYPREDRRIDIDVDVDIEVDGGCEAG